MVIIAAVNNTARSAGCLVDSSVVLTHRSVQGAWRCQLLLTSVCAVYTWRPAGATLSWAYDSNALNTMAMVKHRIMLSGGVIASMAMSDDAFERFKTYGTQRDDVYSPFEDLARAVSAIMHAIFCYGWWDNPQDSADGWWLCKNRCAAQLPCS